MRGCQDRSGSFGEGNILFLMLAIEQELSGCLARSIVILQTWNEAVVASMEAVSCPEGWNETGTIVTYCVEKILGAALPWSTPIALLHGVAKLLFRAYECTVLGTVVGFRSWVRGTATHH